MYPGRSIWARGVLALGAGTLLLSSGWCGERSATRRTPARRGEVAGGGSDLGDLGASYLSAKNVAAGDERRKPLTLAKEISAGTTGGAGRRDFRAIDAGGGSGGAASWWWKPGDRRRAIAREVSNNENKPREFVVGRERNRGNDDDRAATSRRDDRPDGGETGARSKSQAERSDDRRKSRISVVASSVNARASRSRQASVNNVRDVDPRSSTSINLPRRDKRNSREGNDRRDTLCGASIAESRRDRNANENERDSSGDGEKENVFRILDSVVPPGSKRRKVTRAEDSRELMVAGDFSWTSQDDDRRGMTDASAVVEPVSYRGDEPPRRRRRRRNARTSGRRRWHHDDDDDDVSSSATGRASDRRPEPAIGDDRRGARRANYYSARSPTPMAYVHIQPAYPPAMAPPTADRKCVRCMVVYKPCPSRPAAGVALPTYRYHEPATKWRGLKYGE